MTKSKLWTKDFIIITVTSFLVFLTFYLLMTTLTLYSIQQFNASQTEAGFAASIFVIGSLLLRLVSGKYIDVIGRKKLLFGSLLLFLIASLLYFTADTFSLLLLVRFIHGAAFGIATTVMATAVMSIIPPERRGEGTSYYSLNTPLATAIGPFLGILITQHADFTMVFVVCTIFSVISIVVMLFAEITEVNLTKEQIQEVKGFKLQDFFEKSALPISSIIFIIGITYASVLTYISPYAIEVNLTGAASIFFIVYAIFLLASRPFTGKLLDIKGDNIVIYPALLLYTIGLVCLSQSYTNWMLLVAAAFIALGFGNMISCSQAVVVNKSPRHRIGLATSTFYIAMDAGIGIGPLIIGIIVPIFGFRGMYMSMAFIVFLTIILYYFVHGKKTGLINEKKRVA
ncbi:MFS transporter [Peribacillus sp. NPDC097675]|uniref:MFS transporter n=1 Tax=Peribacillus sp. NPDC097675 TaxID=3390618 RepID=UPI003D08182E